MNSFFKKTGVITLVCLGLSLIPIEIANAASITWNTTFWDKTGEMVGNGSFSYDPSTETFVDVPPSSSDPYGAQDFYVKTALDSFSATMFGQLWTLTQSSSEVNWLNLAPFFPAQAPSLGVWSQGYHRYTPMGYLAPQWYFQTIPGALVGNQFALQGGEPMPVYPKAPATISGSWILLDGRVPGGLTSGTWTATAVPEPTTILGTAIVGLGLTLRKKFLGTNQHQSR